MRAPVQKHMFEGQLRTVREIHELIPRISESTIRHWVAEKRLPATRMEALTKPRPRTKPSLKLREKIKNLAANAALTKPKIKPRGA